jgi:DNA-directed RNA polymerase subunit F
MGLFDHIEDKEVRAQVIEAHEAELKAARETMMTDLEKKIEEATSGLKNKNKELLDEKKKIQETLKNFENIDPEKAKEALEFLETNAEAQMIKEGKINELIDRKTSQMKSDHEAALAEVMANLEETSTKATTFEKLYKTKMIEDGLRDAAVKAKVRTEAVDDIILRGKREFSLAQDGTIEARDHDGKLKKTLDDKVLTPSNWIDGLKKTSPHYWPDSTGIGARGRYSTDPNDYNAALADAARSGDINAYRKLRKKG